MIQEIQVSNVIVVYFSRFIKSRKHESLRCYVSGWEALSFVIVVITAVGLFVLDSDAAAAAAAVCCLSAKDLMRFAATKIVKTGKNLRVEQKKQTFYPRTSMCEQQICICI